MKHTTFKKIYLFSCRIKIQYLFRLIPDKIYLKTVYFIQLKRKLDLDNPILYNEKLQWLKLHDRKPIYTILVDKYLVKKYVESVIGKEYIIPTIGVYDKFKNIDFSSLPKKFVIKCSHDSGSTFICNKDDIDLKKIRKRINLSLKNNYYWYLREWQYKNVKARILVEELIVDQHNNEINDYKFFCFNGVVKMVMVVVDRSSNPKSNFYDIYFNKLNLRIENPNINQSIKKPKNFDEMIAIAEKLSKNLTHVRIDLYNVDGKIYFSEFTFHHWGGISNIYPAKWDEKLGNWITINF